MTTQSLIRAVRYTPHHHTHAGWAQGDVGQLREHIRQLAELGTSHIVLQPSWFRLQPQATRVSPACMRIIEHCLDAAHEAGLRVIMSLLAVTDAGALTLPGWHSHADVIGWLQGDTTQPVSMQGMPALIDGWWGTLRAANPFRTAPLVAAQHLLIRTVMAYFASHPACEYWMLGAGWSRLSAHITATHAEQWWQQLCEVALIAAPQARLMSLIDAPTLLRSHALHLATLTAYCHTVVVDAAMPELTMRQQRRLSTPAVFCHDVVHALSNKPVVVACAPVFHSATHTHWQQIAWHQHPLAVPCLAGDDAGLYMTQLLHRLHNAGVAGIIWPQGITAAPHHDDLPLAWLPHQLALYDTPQRMHLAGSAWMAWARTLPIRQEAHITIDSERFWHHPAHEFARLWHAYE